MDSRAALTRKPPLTGHNGTVKWHVFLRDGQAFDIDAERVSLDNGAARFHTISSRLADSTGAIICAGSWSRIVSDGSALTWEPPPEPEPEPFRGGFA